MKFFNPSAKYKELLLLEHIEENPNTTQKRIAKVIGAAPSMVNIYLEDFEEKGYLTRDYKSLKIIKYKISSEGKKRKNFLAVTYFHELLKLYNLAELSLDKFLLRLEKEGYKEVIFYGAGEVAEIMLGALRNKKSAPFEVVAVIDDNEELIGQEVLGHRIVARDEIKKITHDGVVITSYAYEDEIMAKLEELNYPEDRIERFFTE